MLIDKIITEQNSVHNKMTTRLLKLSNKDLLAFDSALRFFCPDNDCVDCPCYAPNDERFPLIPCIAVQAHQETLRRGLLNDNEEEENCNE